MNTRNRAFLMRVAIGITVLGLVACPLWLVGYRVNETESLPPGIWRITGTSKPFKRGQVVNFCPPDVISLREAKERGYLRDGPCHGNFEPLFKPIVAVTGDLVLIDQFGVKVNDSEYLPNSRPLEKDGARRKLPKIEHGSYLVAEGEVWVVSSYTPNSFDSRYFGPISEALIHGQAVPVWVRGALP